MTAEVRGDAADTELQGLSPQARAEVLKRKRGRIVPDHASGPIETRPVDLAVRAENGGRGQ